MEVNDIKIDKSYKGLKRIANGDYILDGDLFSAGSIFVDLDDRFVVSGNIEARGSIITGDDIKADGLIKAGCSIKSNGSIIAGNDVKAGGIINAYKSIVSDGNIISGNAIKAGSDIIAGYSIKAGCGITAGKSIEAKNYISSGKRIFAGISNYATSEDCEKTIKCAELLDGEIAYGELVITKKKDICEDCIHKEVCSLKELRCVFRCADNTITNCNRFRGENE